MRAINLCGKSSTLAYAYLRFFTDFLQQYVLRLGILDGWRGLLMAGVLGQYAFHKYACLWSMGQNKARGNKWIVMPPSRSAHPGRIGR